MKIFFLFIPLTFLLVACGEEAAEQPVQEVATVEAVPVQEPESEDAVAEATEVVESQGPLIPSFEDYAVERPEFEVTPDLDISDYEDKLYKTILVNEYKDMPNLAYQYIVIPVQCGANCQTNFIANKATGEIVDDIGSTWGVKTKLNSSLIIADDYTTPLDKPYMNNALTDKVRYYIIQDNEIKLISEVSYEDYYNAKKMDQ